MNPSFRHGLVEGRRALGGAWLATATGSVLLGIGLAALMEAQAIAGADSARQTELRLLQGATFGLMVPLFIFFLSSRLGSDLGTLLASGWPRYGADRRVFAVGRLGFPALAGWVIAALGAVLALGASIAGSDPALRLPMGLTTGVGTVVVIAGLGSACYLAGFALAQLLGGALGRALFLLGDWLLGAGTGVTALPWPRAHLRTLLGGEAVLGMSPLQASGCLLALTVSLTLLYAAKVPR
jgi:hypothetical protein